jgi:hypothetical protein
MKIKIAVALAALTLSTTASAMPDAVPGSWWSNMSRRLNTMADNAGFCRSAASSWICEYY